MQRRTSAELNALLARELSAHYEPAVEVTTRIYRIAEALHEQARGLAAEAGLLPAEFEALYALRLSGKPFSLTPTELYRTLLVTSGGMAKLLKRLEGRGLVTMAAVPEDRRSKRITLTPEGLRLVEQLVPRVIAAETAVVDVLPDTERAALGGLLKRITDRLEKG